LLAKQEVDDRALNRTVLEALSARLAQRPIRVIEIGAGDSITLFRLIPSSMTRPSPIGWQRGELIYLAQQLDLPVGV
jgi:hypothetical protein